MFYLMGLGSGESFVVSDITVEIPEEETNVFIDSINVDITVTIDED